MLIKEANLNSVSLFLCEKIYLFLSSFSFQLCLTYDDAVGTRGAQNSDPRTPRIIRKQMPKRRKRNTEPSATPCQPSWYYDRHEQLWVPFEPRVTTGEYEPAPHRQEHANFATCNHWRKPTCTTLELYARTHERYMEAAETLHGILEGLSLIHI